MPDASTEPPAQSPAAVTRDASGRGLLGNSDEVHDEVHEIEDEVDEASDESFPASDSPQWWSGVPQVQPSP